MHGASVDSSGPSVGASRPLFERLTVHSLRSGTWPAEPQDLSVSDADISAIAAAYDPNRFQAPVVLGHPETDEPAWGWVMSAFAAVDGLHLEIEVLPEMATLIRERRYQHVSLALWLPGAPANPTPSTYGIKHLGFLGAAAPAVKGLAPVRLHSSSPSDLLFVTFAESPMSDSKPDQSVANTIELSAREQALAEREQALTAREREIRRSGFEAEFGVHVAAGRLLAADVTPLVELAERLTAAPVVTLSEGNQSAVDVLRSFVAGLPSRVELGERSSATSTPAVRAPAVPQGYRLSERGLALHASAVSLQAAKPGLSYADAARAAESALRH